MAEDKEKYVQLQKLLDHMERLNLGDYFELMQNPVKLIYRNFLAGLARGIGMAVGFTILGAVIVYALKQVVLLNLPYISDLIANIVRMVVERYY